MPGNPTFSGVRAGRVAHPFVSLFALGDLSSPAMNQFGQLIPRLPFLGVTFDLVFASILFYISS
jgi:hypothetical protein